MTDNLVTGLMVFLETAVSIWLWSVVLAVVLFIAFVLIACLYGIVMDVVTGFPHG